MKTSQKVEIANRLGYIEKGYRWIDYLRRAVETNGWICAPIFGEKGSGKSNTLLQHGYMAIHGADSKDEIGRPTVTDWNDEKTWDLVINKLTVFRPEQFIGLLQETKGETINFLGWDDISAYLSRTLYQTDLRAWQQISESWEIVRTRISVFECTLPRKDRLLSSLLGDITHDIHLSSRREYDIQCWYMTRDYYHPEKINKQSVDIEHGFLKLENIPKDIFQKYQERRLALAEEKEKELIEVLDKMEHPEKYEKFRAVCRKCGHVWDTKKEDVIYCIRCSGKDCVAVMGKIGPDGQLTGEIKQRKTKDEDVTPEEHYSIIENYSWGRNPWVIGTRLAISDRVIQHHLTYHNDAVQDKGECDLCATQPQTKEELSKSQLELKRKTKPKFNAAAIQQIAQKSAGASMEIKTISEEDTHFSELIREGLEKQGIATQILTAFFAKQNKPDASNKQLAEAFGLDQTEIERTTQDIKMKLDSVATEALHSMKPDKSQIQVKVLTDGKKLDKFTLNTWYYDLRSLSWLAKIEPQTAATPPAPSQVEVKQGDGDRLELNISTSLQATSAVTKRTIETSKSFGLGIDQSQTFTIFDNLKLELAKNDVVYVTGDSGSGKSFLLKELKPILEKNFGKVVCEGNPQLGPTTPDPEEVVIESIGSDFNEAVSTLAAAGLSEAFIMLRKYSQLSDGQKYRYRIAKTINDKDAQVWMFDEFGATLDRETAKCVAYTLQKAARQKGKLLICATTHDDLVSDLNPTLLIRKLFGSAVDIKRYEYEKRPCSLMFEIKIDEGSIDEFEQLEQFHYKGAERPIVKRIYIARGAGGKLVGGIMYASPGPHLAGRSIAVPEYTGMTNEETMRMINRDFLRIARVVILPKYRGIGLGVKLVKETIGRTGYPFIETLAVMAKFNPFFEHAGMTRINVPSAEDRDPAYARSLEKLSQLGFDLEMITSPSYNSAVISGMNETQKLLLQEILKRHFINTHYGGTQFKDGVDRLETESMAACLTKCRLDMAYLIWKNPDPKFASLPQIRQG